MHSALGPGEQAPLLRAGFARGVAGVASCFTLGRGHLGVNLGGFGGCCGRLGFRTLFGALGFTLCLGCFALFSLRRCALLRFGLTLCQDGGIESGLALQATKSLSPGLLCGGHSVLETWFFISCHQTYSDPCVLEMGIPVCAPDSNPVAGLACRDALRSEAASGSIEGVQLISACLTLVCENRAELPTRHQGLRKTKGRRIADRPFHCS